MLCCRPQAVPARLLLTTALLLAVGPALAPPALAMPAARGAAGSRAWLADIGAHALPMAGSDSELEAGGREAPSRSLRGGLPGRQQSGPRWLDQLTVDGGRRQGLGPRYQVALAQPLARTRDGGDRRWLQGDLTEGPADQAGGSLGLYYRPRRLDEDLTLGLSGRVENDWLRDYQRFGVGTELRTDTFELGTFVFDDVGGRDSARSGAGDHRIDGYDLAVGARIPELPSTWIRIRKEWRIGADGDPVAVSDRFSLQLAPLAPLEVETGTVGDGGQRAWFAQLRFRIELGATE